MSFDKTIRVLMSDYAAKYGIGNGWSERYKRNYPHILPVNFINGKMDVESQKQTIYDQNILPSAKGKILMPDGKWQKDAHHLNSSQVMCYNLFRPFMDDNGYISEQGCLFIQKTLGIYLNPQKAVGHFEYESNTLGWEIDAKVKATNFDFHINDGKTEIYFEVKYTVNKFGNAKHNDQQKYDFYLKKVKSILGVDIKTEELKEYYQLISNIIRISTNIYVVFLYPEQNSEVASKFSNFQDFLMGKGTTMPDHVKVLKLEDCKPYVEKDFVEKYLCYMRYMR